MPSATLRQISIAGQDRQISIAGQDRQISIAGQDLTFQVGNSMIFKQASKCETPGCTGSSA